MLNAQNSVYHASNPEAVTWQKQQEGSTQMNGRGAYNRKFPRDSRRNLRTAADGKECCGFLRSTLGSIPAGEIAEDAQCTKRTAENIRAGENAMRMEYLVALCRNNPEFRAAFFEFCGGNLSVPPDLLAMIHKYAKWESGE